jgi:RNA polymerase sigma factor (sigma-70 family)
VSHGASLDDIRLLYEERYADYLRVATAVTGSSESGRDAVHDGFVGVVRSRNSFRGESPLSGWVWRSVVNAALKRRRDDRLDRELPVEGGAEFAARGESPAEEREDARAAIAALPERQRLVLFLRHYADLDYDAVGVALGISSGTVGATLHAAHASLRRSLEEVPIK